MEMKKENLQLILILGLKARLCSNGARSPEVTNFGYRATRKNYWLPEEVPLCKVHGATKKTKVYNTLVLVHCPNEAW